jgi:hypothetical protein
MAAPAAAAPISKLPVYATFDVHGEPTSAGQRWKKYVQRLENLFIALNIHTDSRKRALLLHYAGPEVYDIFDALPDADKGGAEEHK